MAVKNRVCEIFWLGEEVKETGLPPLPTKPLRPVLLFVILQEWLVWTVWSSRIQRPGRINYGSWL